MWLLELDDLKLRGPKLWRSLKANVARGQDVWSVSFVWSASLADVCGPIPELKILSN
jgi:hypothetical protein